MFRHTMRGMLSALMILALALALGACGPGEGASEQDADAADTAQPEGAQAGDQAGDAGGDPEDPKSTPLAIATVGGAEDVDLFLDTTAYKTYESVDELAVALAGGEVNVAVVPADAASRLYFATGGSLLAVDALIREDGTLPYVSVVSVSLFQGDPEAVVGYVAWHGGVAQGGAGAVAFVQGSQMQSAVTSVLKALYVEDPMLVGGELPPDNFYFLG